MFITDPEITRSFKKKRQGSSICILSPMIQRVIIVLILAELSNTKTRSGVDCFYLSARQWITDVVPECQLRKQPKRAQAGRSGQKGRGAK